MLIVLQNILVRHYTFDIKFLWAWKYIHVFPNMPGPVLGTWAWKYIHGK